MDRTLFSANLILWLAVVATATIFKDQHDQYEKGEKVQSLLPTVYNATVSKDKAWAHPTIVDALAAAPTNSDTKYYIHVEAGIYIERIQVWKNLSNIVLVGDGAPMTKVQWNRHAPNFSTSQTGTISVEGNGFIGMFLTFENTVEGGQAAAAVIEADYVAFYKCIFLGHQDTLYARSGIQFYRECDVYGTVDFIFGAAAAIFQSCMIYARGVKYITFTAQSRGPPNPKLPRPPPSGFVIQNCTLTVASDFELLKPDIIAYLGRPWFAYSTVVVMESFLDSIIQPAGWSEWTSGTDKLIYMEFNNRGPGSSTNKRVNWTGYHDVTGHPEKIQNFTVGEFINEGDWIGRAGIPYNNGFIYISPESVG